jgi:MFS family permease
MALALIPSFLLNLAKQSKEELAETGAWYKNIIAVNAISPAVIMLLMTIAFSNYSAYLYPYAQAMGIEGIGAFFTVFAGGLFVSRLISGKLIDQYGSFKMIFIGMSVLAVSFVLVGLSRSLNSLLGAAAVASLGYGIAQPAIQTMCIQAVIPAKRAAASNTNYFGLDLGLFLGPLIGGMIYSRTGGYSQMYISMIVPIGLSVLVLALTWKSYEQNRKQAGS